MMHKNGDMYYIPVTIDNIIEEGNMTRVVTKKEQLSILQNPKWKKLRRFRRKIIALSRR